MSQTTVAGSFITLNTIDSDHYVDGSIDLVHIGANQIDGTKIAMSSDARGDVLVYDGTNYVRLGADDGKFLRSNGTGSNPSWETAGGGLVFIDTAVASTSSTLEVTLTGSYETYLISGSDLDFSNDVVQINGRMGTSSAWADEYKNAYHRVRSDNVHDHAYSNSQAYMQLSSSIGNATGEGATFTVWFNKPIGIADTYPMIHGTMMAINHNHQVEAGEIHSMGISALNVARFKIYPSAGTFTSGRLTVWGLVHA